jgi:hypothetical protein
MSDPGEILQRLLATLAEGKSRETTDWRAAPAYV